MAMKNSLLLLLMLMLSSSFFFFLVVARKQHDLETKEDITNHYHNLQTTSFLPSSICTRSTKGHKKKGTVEVVHKHGPCSTFSKDMVKPLSVEEILTLDQDRVKSINSRLTINTDRKNNTLGTSKTTLPAKPGITIGSGDYIVTVGLGTPKKDLSLVFDSGSSLTWTQCQPCAGSCYAQQEPIFEPASSTTYSDISCTAPECAALTFATGNLPGCERSSSRCVYSATYGDGSFSDGYFGKDKLTLTSQDVIEDFYLGCGQDNEGLFNGAAGLLGLGSDELSLVSQSADKYGKVFSYCLPSQPSYTGYLTFGKEGVAANNVAYTPFSDVNSYGIELEAIFVGGKNLGISPTVFSSSGTIIDSGTVITRLPATAYAALRQAFRAGMTKYTLTKPLGIFDTCYDFSNVATVTVPGISMLWAGNTRLDIPFQGILLGNGISQVCLAFAGNKDDSGVGIFGNYQQKTLEVVYDLPGGKVGFAYGGCD